jgi:para-aminobenzoate synthetase component 2
MLLLLDHYDSFTHNLARYFKRLGASVDLREEDRVVPADLNPAHYSGLICRRVPAGRNRPLLLSSCSTAGLAAADPGICLGHQIIAHYFQAVVVQTPRRAMGTIR